MDIGTAMAVFGVDKITELVAPLIETLGFELWGVRWVQQTRRRTLQIFIDHPEGITVENCALVSHNLNVLLDVEMAGSTRYDLEVSSPGLDRHLFTLEQLQAHIGSYVRVQLISPLENRKRFHGCIVSANLQNLALEAGSQTFELPQSNISSVQVDPFPPKKDTTRKRAPHSRLA